MYLDFTLLVSKLWAESMRQRNDIDADKILTRILINYNILLLRVHSTIKGGGCIYVVPPVLFPERKTGRKQIGLRMLRIFFYYRTLHAFSKKKVVCTLSPSVVFCAENRVIFF